MRGNTKIFDLAFKKVVNLGNKIAEGDHDADLKDIADGILGGVLQFWLYSRQPCNNPRCMECLNTAQERMAELTAMVKDLSEGSDYLHNINDVNVGRA